MLTSPRNPPWLQCLPRAQIKHIQIWTLVTWILLKRKKTRGLGLLVLRALAYLGSRAACSVFSGTHSRVISVIKSGGGYTLCCLSTLQLENCHPCLLLLFSPDLLCLEFSCGFAWDLVYEQLVQEAESIHAAGSPWRDDLFHVMDNIIVALVTVGCCRGLTSKWIPKVTEGMSTWGDYMQKFDVTLSQMFLYLYTFRSVLKKGSFEMCWFWNAFLNIYYLSLKETK